MIQLTSSIVSSTITTCLVYPAERVKIQMHLDTEIKSTKEAIMKIINRDGMGGLYTGLTSEIFGNGLAYAIYFVAYSKAKTVLGFDPNSFFSISKCSGSAGCVSAIATNPFWVLKTKQAERRVPIFKAAKDLIDSEGFLALWKGLLASLILVLNPIIQFGIYQWLKKKVTLNKKSAFYDLLIFIIGAVSKIVATLFTYPYTFIRTKQHVNKTKGQTLLQTFMIELDKNGFLGLFTGMKAKIFQSVLNSALMLTIYERTNLTLKLLLTKMAKK